ncbi:MAG: fibrobacter succinogenes major paralogous domain-containing protein [Proteobacteria bacterium]|nr:fibrobacter succinogenes major paralogous domain-containing protein [Pseudomonadota bacterium]
MKIPFTFLAAILLTASSFLPQQANAQAPEKMSYQAIVRDSDGNLVASQLVGMQISILQTSAGGTAVYVETQTPTTNVNGLVTLEIGTGSVVSGDFTTIDWSGDTYFIKTETDPTGGASYTITGTSQLLSVPYALHAKTVSSITETDPSVPVGTTAGDMQYWNGSAWEVVDATPNEGAALQMIGGIPTWVGGTALVPNVTNPTTGKVWMDRNLGATQVATSSTDAASYGDLYQWGRGADGHQLRNSATTTTLSSSDTPGNANFILTSSSPYDWRNPQNNNLWQGVSGVNNPCPTGYRLPTDVELNAERLSWSSNNAAGAYNSPLKLPVAGFRVFSDGSLVDVGSDGYCWSSTVDGTNSRALGFGSGTALMSSIERALGFPVRCIKE